MGYVSGMIEVIEFKTRYFYKGGVDDENIKNFNIVGWKVGDIKEG